MSTETAAPPPLPPARDQKLRHMADALRALAMDAVEQAKSGHPGMPMGMADIAAVLFTEFLRFDPLVPDWPDRVHRERAQRIGHVAELRVPRRGERWRRSGFGAHDLAG